MKDFRRITRELALLSRRWLSLKRRHAYEDVHPLLDDTASLVEALGDSIPALYATYTKEILPKKIENHLIEVFNYNFKSRPCRLDVYLANPSIVRSASVGVRLDWEGEGACESFPCYLIDLQKAIEDFDKTLEKFYRENDISIMGFCLRAALFDLNLHPDYFETFYNARNFKEGGEKGLEYFYKGLPIPRNPAVKHTLYFRIPEKRSSNISWIISEMSRVISEWLNKVKVEHKGSLEYLKDPYLNEKPWENE